MNTSSFEKYESAVRSYCRNFPAVFNRAKGAMMYDEDGNVKEMYRVIKRNKLLLYTMSDELYKYSLAKELIEDNADMFAGLAPSNFCYSNIVGGYGIFGGVSIVETDWITPEFIEKNR